ncbi:hypothetical protein NQ318_009254 [Aromia moschata]|uniref:UDENN domain-containing protein n=1 Tax=Aromia moschata TaxID=1265417 RepID=A0AAV8Y9I9_9CUCU|nr:hypothetical protein NQ318_009254 [Aromia moschata]
MCLITHAYFDEGDFSKVSILEDTYHHLNAVIQQSDVLNQMYVGLSARDFILQWKHKAVLLFKLLLLEKRVIFYKSPVHPLCTTILSLISLFPDMIECGLSQSASIRLSRPMSPMPEFSDEDLSPVKNKRFANGELINGNGNKVTENTSSQPEINKNSISPKNAEDLENSTNRNGITNDNLAEVAVELTESLNVQAKEDNSDVANIGEKSNSLRREASADTISDTVQNNMAYLAHLSTQSCGFPLSIFTKGSLCLPYLSLPYLDLLTDVNVRSYVVGATNILFKQKRQLYDILVDIDANRIECQDLNLRKYLHLSTEDLRFADYIVKHVSEERHDVFLDGVGWEGGGRVDKSAVQDLPVVPVADFYAAREIDHFNTSFITAWRETHNYKVWLSGVNPELIPIVHPGHPFAGQLSVADMRLRLAHTMQNTESGRKINQAMASTGKAVATTSKAVGGAFSQARGAFSSWWSNFLVSPEPGQKGSDSALDEATGAEETDHATDNAINIPNSITNDKDNDNLANGTAVKDRDDNVNGTEGLAENHQPGEVHTV